MPTARKPGSAVAAGVLLLALGACDGPPEIRHRQAFLMGTVVEISATGVGPEAFREATAAAFREMRALHNALSPLRGESELARFNRRARSGWVPLDGPLVDLLPRALSVQRASGNAFNPHLGRFVALWGFRQPPFPQEPPPARAIRGLLASGAGAEALALRRRGHRLQARLLRAGAALDLGGIAKGYAVDRAVAILREHGITNALVNAGGDMRALGRRGSRSWRIGIRHPRNRQRVIAVIDLRPGEAIVTSGDYERFFRAGGRRYHHLLEPGTGHPARRARQATVLGSRATEADAWSTALFVRGAAGLGKLGPSQPGLVIDTDGEAHANPAMEERLSWRSEGIPPP